nr:uncharacterized protein LOC124819170 [Hydra vulgaris]
MRCSKYILYNFCSKTVQRSSKKFKNKDVNRASNSRPIGLKFEVHHTTKRKVLGEILAVLSQSTTDEHLVGSLRLLSDVTKLTQSPICISNINENCFVSVSEIECAPVNFIIHKNVMNPLANKVVSLKDMLVLLAQWACIEVQLGELENTFLQVNYLA